MEQARNLSVLIPDLKIIHLVRDPRPTLKSQASLGECCGLERQQCAERFSVQWLKIILLELIRTPGRKDDCIICTTRGNSTEHVDKWKKTMNKTFVKVIQNRCNYLLKRFGYDF
ncbi:hypothetical protein MAR_010626, partial [Mya arenaria]